MPVTVRPITDQVVGADKTPSHCEPVFLLGLNIIDEATFLPRTPAAAPLFLYQPSMKARVGVFAATAGNVTRAWILLLPETGITDRIMIGIPPSIGQGQEAADYYAALGASNPLSPPLIRDYLALINGIDPYSGDTRDGKVQACYGSQVMGGGRTMALLMPVRALLNAGGADGELGPFADDGDVIADTVNAIAAATQGAFTPRNVEVFTHSNGIVACNAFLRAVQGTLPLRVAIALDPASAQSLDRTTVGELMQNLSGQTGGIVNGRPTGNFEYWPFERWKNEPDRASTMRSFHNDLFQYLHNYAFPRYLLRLSIRVTHG